MLAFWNVGCGMKISLSDDVIKGLDATLIYCSREGASTDKDRLAVLESRLSELEDKVADIKST